MKKKVELKLFHEKGTNKTDKKLSNSFLIWDKKNWEIEKFDKSNVLVSTFFENEVFLYLLEVRPYARR